MCLTNPNGLEYLHSMLDKAIREYLASLGKKGGSSTSKAKAKAARENGKKGGRPRKDGSK